MPEKGRQQVSKYGLVAFNVLLFFLSVSILWTLLKTDYPTHSDVFYIGVEFGVMSVILLLCLLLICASLYHFFHKS